MTTLVLGVCESHLWRSGVSRSISEPSLRTANTLVFSRVSCLVAQAAGEASVPQAGHDELPSGVRT
jgi:hypothetical protein